MNGLIEFLNRAERLTKQFAELNGSFIQRLQNLAGEGPTLFVADGDSLRPVPSVKYAGKSAVAFSPVDGLLWTAEEKDLRSWNLDELTLHSEWSNTASEIKYGHSSLTCLRVAPEDVSLILLTHGHLDHLGGVTRLREHLDAPVALHAADARLAWTSAALSVVLASPVASAQTTIRLRIATGHPPAVVYAGQMRDYFQVELKKRVESKTKHKIEWVEGYGGSIVKVAETLGGVRDGIVDIGGFCFCFEPANLPMHAFQVMLPFGPVDPIDSLRVAQDVYAQVPYLTSVFEQRFNQKLLARITDSSYNLGTNFEWKSLSELRGRRIAGAGLNLNWLKYAGVTPVQSSLPEAYTSMQMRVYDGWIMFPSAWVNLKLHEVGPFYTLIGFGTITWHGLTINSDTWKKLPKEVQDIMVAVASGYKARGILKRLATTPLSPARFIGVQTLTYVGLGVVASALVLTIGRLVGGTIVLTPNLFWLIPLIGLVAVTSIAMGYAIAGFTPNPQTANNVGATVTFLMFGFSGVMFPVDALPGALPDIVPYAVPHTALIEIIRGIVLTGDTIANHGRQLLIGAGWLAVAFTAASLFYHFTED